MSSLALAVAGSQAAHAFVYRLAAPDPRERGDLLAATGHAYLEHAPLAVAVVSVLLVLALLSEVRGARVGAPAARPRAWIFATVAPAVFVCQEHLERLLRDGSFPWGAGLERTFLLGLVLQAPFALAAFLLARALLRVAGLLGSLLGERPRTSEQAPSRSRPLARVAPSPATCGLSLGARGPPAPSL
jgi:hypothetical protein